MSPFFYFLQQRMVKADLGQSLGSRESGTVAVGAMEHITRGVHVPVDEEGSTPSGDKAWARVNRGAAAKGDLGQSLGQREHTWLV